MRLWFTGYLNPGMPAKLNSSQLCKQARLIVALSPTGGTITKTLFICRLFQWLMGLIQKWNALPQVMSHFQMLLGLAGLILIHPTDWLRRCPFIWEYTLVATRNIAALYLWHACEVELVNYVSKLVVKTRTVYFAADFCSHMGNVCPVVPAVVW